MKLMKIRYMKQMIRSIVVFIILMNILFNSNDVLSKIVSIPFLLFSVSLFLKNLFLMLNKKRIALKCSKLLLISFSIYYFSFLFYWNYVSIINKEYVSFIFGIGMGICGGYIISRRLKKEK